MRISDWSSDVCSSDLRAVGAQMQHRPEDLARILIERRAEVEQQMRVLARGEAVTVDADAPAVGAFGADAAVDHRHRKITRAPLTGRMLDPLPIAPPGVWGSAWCALECLDRAYHD